MQRRNLLKQNELQSCSKNDSTSRCDICNGRFLQVQTSSTNESSEESIVDIQSISNTDLVCLKKYPYLITLPSGQLCALDRNIHLNFLRLRNSSSECLLTPQSSKEKYKVLEDQNYVNWRCNEILNALSKNVYCNYPADESVFYVTDQSKKPCEKNCWCSPNKPKLCTREACDKSVVQVSCPCDKNPNERQNSTDRCRKKSIQVEAKDLQKDMSLKPCEKDCWCPPGGPKICTREVCDRSNIRICCKCNPKTTENQREPPERVDKQEKRDASQVARCEEACTDTCSKGTDTITKNPPAEGATKEKKLNGAKSRVNSGNRKKMKTETGSAGAKKGKTKTGAETPKKETQRVGRPKTRRNANDMPNQAKSKPRGLSSKSNSSKERSPAARKSKRSKTPPPGQRSRSSKSHGSQSSRNSSTSNHAAGDTRNASAERRSVQGVDSNVKDSINEHEYLQFALRITEDIIKNDLYTSCEMRRVFNSHIEANRGRLDMDKMKEQVRLLAKELNVTYNESEVYTLGPCRYQRPPRDDGTGCELIYVANDMPDFDDTDFSVQEKQRHSSSLKPLEKESTESRPYKCCDATTNTQQPGFQNISIGTEPVDVGKVCVVGALCMNASCGSAKRDLEADVATSMSDQKTESSKSVTLQSPKPSSELNDDLSKQESSKESLKESLKESSSENTSVPEEIIRQLLTAPTTHEPKEKPQQTKKTCYFTPTKLVNNVEVTTDDGKYTSKELCRNNVPFHTKPLEMRQKYFVPTSAEHIELKEDKLQGKPKKSRPKTLDKAKEESECCTCPLEKDHADSIWNDGDEVYYGRRKAKPEKQSETRIDSRADILPQSNIALSSTDVDLQPQKETPINYGTICCSKGLIGDEYCLMDPLPNVLARFFPSVSTQTESVDLLMIDEDLQSEKSEAKPPKAEQKTKKEPQKLKKMKEIDLEEETVQLLKLKDVDVDYSAQDISREESSSKDEDDVKRSGSLVVKSATKTSKASTKTDVATADTSKEQTAQSILTLMMSEEKSKELQSYKELGREGSLPRSLEEKIEEMKRRRPSSGPELVQEDEEAPIPRSISDAIEAHNINIIRASGSDIKSDEIVKKISNLITPDNALKSIPETPEKEVELDPATEKVLKSISGALDRREAKKSRTSTDDLMKKLKESNPAMRKAAFGEKKIDSDDESNAPETFRLERHKESSIHTIPIIVPDTKEIQKDAQSIVSSLQNDDVVQYAVSKEKAARNPSDIEEFMKKLEEKVEVSTTRSLDKRVKKTLTEGEMFRHPENRRIGFESHSGIDLTTEEAPVVEGGRSHATKNTDSESEIEERH